MDGDVNRTTLNYILKTIKKRLLMSLAKVIEVIAEGESVEQAVQNAVTQASKTVQNIKSVNCENIQGIVSNNQIEKYRVNAKVTFVVENS